MHSFLIISKDKNQTDKKVGEILSKNKIDIFDRNFFAFEKSVGIEDIRKIQEKLYLKPFQSEKKALIIDLYLGITIEAQNALLKTLEEPPAKTIIIVTTDNKEDLLPTILSRCTLYEIKEDPGGTSVDFQKEVNRILDSDTGEKMEIAQEYSKDRESAVKFVENAVLTASDLAKKGDSESFLSLLLNLNIAYSELRNSNINPRLILENYLLSI